MDCADDNSRNASPWTRRRLLGLGAALPAGMMLARFARAQGFTEAPIAPPEARGNLDHRFWRDLLEDFPLEPNERYFATADLGIQPLQTLDRMHRVATELAAHAASVQSDHVETARAATARFFGAEAHEIALLHDATEAMATLAEALPLDPGAVVAISTDEPPSTLTPWVSLARVGRIRLQPYAPDAAGSGWKRGLQGASALVVSHVSPATGEILPLQEICTAAHASKALVIVNGSHAAGIVPFALRDLEVDAYIAAGSGFLLGPQGTAILYARASLLSRLAPRYRPVDNIRDAGTPTTRGIEAASVLETQALSPGLAAGLAASLEWLGGLGIEVVREHATILSRTLFESITSISGIEPLGTAATVAAVPILCIRIPKRPYTQVAEWLQSEHAVRVYPVSTPGLNCVRASTHVINRKTDVDHLIEGLRRLALE